MSKGNFLTKEVPFNDRVVVEMTDIASFVRIPEERKTLIHSVDVVLERFVVAYSRGTVVDQAKSMEDFTEWPNQGVVVGLGKGLDLESLGISLGDSVFLRGPNGVSMKIEGRILRVISTKDIYIVKKR